MDNSVVVRRVDTDDALVATYLAIGRQFDPAWSEGDSRLAQTFRDIRNQPRMVIQLQSAGQIRGGVIAFGSEIVTVRAIGLDPELRSMGLGRRLLDAVETLALAGGARSIVLGAVDDARGFYERLGYRGKHAMREKQLPLPGAVRTRLTKARLDRTGDLAVGVVVADTGVVEPLV